MKLLRSGAEIGPSTTLMIRDDEQVLVQCPDTGIVYVLEKKRSSSGDCYYVTPQFSSFGREDNRHVIFQYYGEGNRRVHFSDSQIDWAIRSGNFKVERV